MSGAPSVRGFAPHPYPNLDATDVCIYSGAFLLRNLAGRPYPVMLGKSRNDKDWDAIRDAVRPAMARAFPDADYRHSPGCPRGLEGFFVRTTYQTQENATCEASMETYRPRANNGEYVFLNHSDHVTVYFSNRGCDLDAPFENVCARTEALARHLNFAWDPSLGYLSSAVETVGTGLQMFRLLHLEALYELGELDACLHATNALRLKYCGVDLAECKGAGHFYQFSNSRTMGLAEREIVEDFRLKTDALIEQELNARIRLVRENRPVMSDAVRRAIAVMQNCRLVGEVEMLDLLGTARMAVSMGFATGVPLGEIDALILSLIPQDPYCNDVPQEQIDAMDEDRARKLRMFSMRLEPVERGRRALD